MARNKKQKADNEKDPVIGRYINPFTDFGFKKIFGEEPNKDILIDFLNELLRPQNHQISDLTYKKTDRLGATDIDRNVVFDLYCENASGEKFIVEMQKAKQSKEERAAYENSIKYYRDLKNSIDTAERDGYQKAKGELIPIITQAKAREEEERKQKEEAKARIARSIIRRHKRGDTIEDIAEDFEMKVNEVKEIITSKDKQ